MLALKKKGFTLIEIVIVLAIAALILAIVFLAVGGAQRSQRDQASKDAAGKVVAAFSSFLGDDADALVAAGTAIPTSYLTDIRDGRAVTPTSEAGAATKTKFIYLAGGTCASGTITAGTGNTNKVVVSYFSESANSAVCLSN